MGAVKEAWMGIWEPFSKNHPKLAKWIYQIGLFFIFSNGVTIFQYLVFTFLPGILGMGLAGTEFMVPQAAMSLFGVDFTWSLIGTPVHYDAMGAVVIGGGLGYTISYWLGTFLAQCINFPLQRNLTFKRHGLGVRCRGGRRGVGPPRRHRGGDAGAPHPMRRPAQPPRS